MEHEKIRENLGAFQDGELSPDKRFEISVHLTACPECRELQKSWQKISETLFHSRGFVSSQETEKFIAQTMAKIIPSPPWRIWVLSQSLWKWLTPVLELSFAAALFFFVLGSSDSLASPDTLLLLGSKRDMAELVLTPGVAYGPSWFNSLLEGK